MEEDKLTVLIVDDEEPIRSILSRKLEFDGYNCEVAADGKEALRKASMKSFDLVLLDINMPGLSGMEVLRRLTADHPDICVIMITAMADTTMHIEALRLGAYDYVTKPFDLDDLSTRVKNALEIRRLVLKNGGRQLAPEQNEAFRSLICGQISLGELKPIQLTQERASTPGAEFAIPTFGSATHPQELARYMQMAQKLVLMAEIFRASIREHEMWASLLGEDIANQPRDYNELTRLIGELHLAATSCTGVKIHILDYGFLESTPLTQAEYSGIRGQHTPTDMIMSHLERLSSIMPIAGDSSKWQREAGYHNNAPRRPYQFQSDNKEALETFMKMTRGQWDSGVVDSFLQILGRQVIMSQVPTLVET